MYARECRRETDTVCACQLHGMVKGKRKKVPRSIWRLRGRSLSTGRVGDLEQAMKRCVLEIIPLE